MGTRNLTVVVSNGITRIAQYCQWDGYPSGQGYTILRFLRRCKLDKLKHQVDKTSFYDAVLDKAELESIESIDNWFELYPHLSRDFGGEIIRYVYKSRNPPKLCNNYKLLSDGLLFNWVYVVDLDKNTFEVYRGCNTKPLDSNERFYNMTDMKQVREYFDLFKSYSYYPVKHIVSFNLNELPKKEKFLDVINKICGDE